MSTREIPRQEWDTFFNAFSQEHQGWLVNVEILDPNLGSQVQAEDLAFRDITISSNQTDRTGIMINVGDTADEHVTHLVNDPIHVRVAQNDQGIDEALEVESKNSGTTIVRFREAAKPEMLNGMQAKSP